ncbi:two-component system response regulator [Erysipelothrix larvae]|uniref:Two-component system response regulator n=1 Tax=Erysipelothrix larvae TaxID=1514105 RepID=A0A109UGY3_9FIRM|nr:response regulator transcription factor [Erysipelothrix larvae]AMC93303.1 two-component system response regulator [Erysipelothrix larvae]
MIKLLIVDDEVNVRNVVKEYSKAAGYDCHEASDGLVALQMIKEQDFDVVVMDIMMPNLDGFSACREIKAIKDVPIIMLSARQEVFDKLLGFELGIDDYVTKPFTPRELMARIKAVSERSKNGLQQTYEYGGLVVDVVGRTLTVDGERIDITPKEFDLLVYLMQHEKMALTRDALLDKVWKYNFYGDLRTVDTHIKMLRQSLGPYRDYIVTLRGVGYKFEVQDK